MYAKQRTGVWKGSRKLFVVRLSKGRPLPFTLRNHAAS